MIFAVAMVMPSALASGVGQAADAARGGALAERWCSGCHVVNATQSSASGGDAAPPFRAIAALPGHDQAWLEAFLADPHRPAMKGIALPRAEIADLAAYIANLK
jgi:mono/diheme cytochrome c family protein